MRILKEFVDMVVLWSFQCWMTCAQIESGNWNICNSSDICVSINTISYCPSILTYVILLFCINSSKGYCKELKREETEIK